VASAVTAQTDTQLGTQLDAQTAASLALGSTQRRAQRPTWLPAFIPAFDGLRGVAILAVVLYHCHPRLEGTFVAPLVIWGWSGVSLFFVLSGFLITGIILDAGPSPRFYANFYARRFLRIWPVYWLLLFLFYFFFPLIFSGHVWMLQNAAAAPWLVLVLFVQNLWPIALPGSIGPTWSLAIEQQFYLFWTPLARRIPPRWLLLPAAAMLVASPLVRQFLAGHLTPTNTLTHLDGLAVGSIVAIALRVVDWPQHIWRWIARAALAVGASGVALMLYRGSAWTDTLLAIGFGGMLLTAILGQALQNAPTSPDHASLDNATPDHSATDQPMPNHAALDKAPLDKTAPRPSLYCRALTLRPLLFVGKISYGLYVTHVLVFSMMGGYVDKPLNRYGIPGNLAIVAIRLVASIGFAALMWHFFEKPILGLKRYFNFR
jgi:peptidoglycan/LPS O-acetylase OafA/YrhL